MKIELYKITVNDIEPLDDDILVIDMENGQKLLQSGIIILDDNGKNRGIRPRWARVFKVGKNVIDVSEGEWILIDHGRWTYRHTIEFSDGNVLDVQKVDPTGILGAMSKDYFNENNLFAQVSNATDIVQK